MKLLESPLDIDELDVEADVALDAFDELLDDPLEVALGGVRLAFGNTKLAGQYLSGKREGLDYNY